ncbi:MAG: C25 family cysteine peptidase [Caldilineales bacterium]
MTWNTTQHRLLPALVLIALGLALAACSAGDKAPQPGPQGATAPPRAAGSDDAPATPVDAVKIVVEEPWLYRVTAAELAAAGFDLAGQDATQLALTVGGEPVAFSVEGSGDAQALTFYGQPRASRYGIQNVYWLSKAQGDAETVSVATADATPGAGAPDTTFRASQRVEASTHYLSQITDSDDHWLWESLFAPATYTVTFDLPGYAGGDADLSISLWGNSEDRSDPDHSAVLRLNGETIGESTWDGKGWKTLTETVSADNLLPAGNELAIELPGDTEAVVDMVYINQVEVSYDRELAAAAGEQLAFTLPGATDATVSGSAGDDALLWDVTDPRMPVALTGTVAGTDGLRLRTAAGDALRTVVLAPLDALLSPAAVLPADGADLRDNPEGADYIAVAYPDFIPALQPLMDYRRSQGLRLTVASIDDVYDTFSHGAPDPAAIRDYMIYARDNWSGPAPRFLLLVGDATYDYQGFLQDSTPNFVPTYLLSTHFVGETASDNWFVSLNEENDLPDMAVGRIPAQTAQQVEDVVAKTLAYESDTTAGDWAGRALFVADNEQEGFQTIADNLAEDALPASYQIDKVYLGASENPTAQIVQSMDDGVGLVTYVGHGSMNVWGKDKMFQISDTDALDNTRLPFLVTMTCLVGYFHHPTATSMGEELLLNPKGGVVAALVPTSESLASDQTELATNVYGHLFSDAGTVGEAIMLGKRDLNLDRNLMQDLIETFTLLGDPALVLQKPG